MWSDVNLWFCHRTNLMFLLCHIIVQRHLDLLIIYTLLFRTNKQKMNQRQSVLCSTWYVNDRRWEINISTLNLPFQQRFLGQPGHIRTLRSKKKLLKIVRDSTNHPPKTPNNKNQDTKDLYFLLQVHLFCRGFGTQVVAREQLLGVGSLLASSFLGTKVRFSSLAANTFYRLSITSPMKGFSEEKMTLRNKGK